MDISTQSMSKATVGKYQAFQVGQTTALSEAPGFTLQQSTLVTVEGTDVFTIFSFGGTNDPVPTSLMLKVINRVKKLH